MSAFFERSKGKWKQIRQKKSRSSRKLQSKGHRQVPEDFQGVGVPTDMISSLHQAHIHLFPYTKARWTQFSQPSQQLEAQPNATLDIKGSRGWANNCPHRGQISFLHDKQRYSKASRSNSTIYWLLTPCACCLESEISLDGKTRLIHKGILEDLDYHMDNSAVASQV